MAALLLSDSFAEARAVETSARWALIPSRGGRRPALSTECGAATTATASARRTAAVPTSLPDFSIAISAATNAIQVDPEVHPDAGSWLADVRQRQPSPARLLRPGPVRCVASNRPPELRRAQAAVAGGGSW